MKKKTEQVIASVLAFILALLMLNIIPLVVILFVYQDNPFSVLALKSNYIARFGFMIFNFYLVRALIIVNGVKK